MEQWRSGSSASVDEFLAFEYSLDAADLLDPTATWLPLSSFGLAEQLTGTTSAGAVDGNLAANQLRLEGALSGLNWAADEVLTFRWTDVNDSGSDGLYAVDDFSLASVSPVPEPSCLGAGAVGAALLIALMRRRQAADASRH
jgi:hypothetical protein